MRWIEITMQTVADVVDVPQAVKHAVRSVAADADIILYGSRARGDHELDSDWDFLVLLNDDAGDIEDRIRDAVFEIQLQGVPVCIMFESKGVWNSERLRATPFHKNVTLEGRIA